jgi:four helix bundle protein
MISSLEEFKTFNRAMDVAERVWVVVSQWSYFEKDTVGKQLVRAVDSVAANLSEGLGRYHYKERKNFSYYARGSLFETKTWLIKAKSRNLIDSNICTQLIMELETIGKMINSYISTLNDNNSNSSTVNEPEEEYLPQMPNP